MYLYEGNTRSHQTNEYVSMEIKHMRKISSTSIKHFQSCNFIWLIFGCYIIYRREKQHKEKPR